MSTSRSARAGVTALLATLLFAIVAVPAFAQTYQGAIRGLVKDAQGVIPGVEVTIVNEETSAARTVMTNEVGEYAIPSVLPGTYTIRATLAGFKTEERKGLKLATQQQIVQDFTLEIGTLSEQVTVTAEVPLVERSNANAATVMSSEQISALPIFGRNTFYSSISTPGVIQSGDPQFVRYQDQSGASSISMGGGPRRGNAYLLEGVSITDFVNRPSWVPSTEAIEDMRVQVKTYDAEMGRAAGGVFNVTARSGSNQFHGSALYVSKPGWSTGNLFFADRAGTPKPSQYYYGWAGSIGGPVVKDKTFFWFSTDDYKQRSTRNNVLTVPTALERTGDFSQSGITIYDPLTTRANPTGTGFIRDPFPGNKIPLNRLNPIALQYLSGVPMPQTGRSYTASATLDDGPQNQETFKLDQRWNGKWTTTGMYGHQRTKEPSSAFFGTLGTVPVDPGGGTLYRDIHFISANNIFIPNNTTTVAVRYGYNTFNDNGGNFASFDTSALGYPSNVTSLLSENAFPAVTMSGYQNLGHGSASATKHVGQTANLTVSKFMGSHSIKMGGDYRRISAETAPPNTMSFAFTTAYTQGPNPNTASAVAGDAFAGFLLGYPATGEFNTTTSGLYYLDYYSGYVQDDWRTSSKLTLNFGLRYEYEPGIAARDNAFTVGFDRDALFPVQVPGMELTGGLMYAGVDGYPTRQGQPLNGVAPRGGFAYSMTDKTVLRGGYGFFWVPTVAAGTGEAAIGSRGYSAATTMLTSVDGGLTPFNTLSNPFPAGTTPPQGNSLGLLTGAGGDIDFVSQDSKPGYVQQFSFDFQRELPGNMVASLGYQGSRSERLSMGGTSDATVNINQLDPQYQSLGTALQQTVANPFFGIAEFGNLGRSATITRGQLLRPYPQFGNILMHRVNDAKARYNAMVARWQKRMSNGYSVDVNYTFSRLNDNQWGESNSFSNRQGSAMNNYDIDEYGVSLLDVAHRINFSATFQLPFGEGRKWVNGGGIGEALLGGWQITTTGRYQTGFPVNISQSSNNSGLLGSNQRPNLVEGVEVMTTGSQVDRAINGWINPAAFTAAPAFTFGTVPRTNPDWRGPGQRETSLAIQKQQRFAGSKTLSFRIDVLNLFNDPLFNGPVTTFGTSTFGTITSVGGFARSMQFQARLGF